MTEQRCIVLGAGGRDFHDFLTFFRAHRDMRVVCFTAAQIPFIEARSFPKELAGPGYDADIPIHPEPELESLIARHDVAWVFLAYSDLSHEEVMHKASRVLASGASFAILGPKHTDLVSSKPVVSVTAARTGAGKSPLAQALARHLRKRGVRVALLRHPMPYGDLARQRVQRFETPADLDLHDCTIEEREEYEPYLESGIVVWAGVDYRAVLRAAEAECDLVLWDGGNNDLSFLRSDLRIVMLDALRPGHETRFHPGEANLRGADVAVINKVGSAEPDAVARILETLRTVSPRATVIQSDLVIRVDEERSLAGKRVVVIEDGPTVTHGGMAYGAGTIVARRAGAIVVDPRPHAVGTIAAAFREFGHLAAVLPALGYSDTQRKELAETIRRAAPEWVIDASPARVARLLGLAIPTATVRYAFEQRSGRSILDIVEAVASAKDRQRR